METKKRKEYKTEWSRVLTTKQQAVYDYFVNHYNDKTGYPTYAQAGKDFGVAPSVIYAAIDIIIRKGYAWKDNKGQLHFFTDEPQTMDRIEDYVLSWVMGSSVGPKIAKAVAIGICDLANKHKKTIEEVVMDIVTED